MDGGGDLVTGQVSGGDEQPQQELREWLEQYKAPGNHLRGPFDGRRLTRSDIEWLVKDNLANHSSGTNLNLSGAILREQDLSNLRLARRVDKSLPPPELAQGSQAKAKAIVQLVGADLCGANLEDVDLRHADLHDATFCAYDENRKHWVRARLTGAYLSHANLLKASLRGVYLQRANLAHTHLEGADLKGAQLQGAILSEAHLQPDDGNNRTELGGANLDGAILEGTDLYNANLERASLREADLRNARLMRATLTNANLRRAKLQQAHLQWADLHGTQLQGADLTLAHLEMAQLERAQLQRADLTSARLHGANLGKSNLEQTILSSAHFEGASTDDGVWQKEREELERKLADVPERLPAAKLERVVLDVGTELDGTILADETGSASLADIAWSDANLAVVDWTTLRKYGVGEERQLHMYTRARSAERIKALAADKAATPKSVDESQEEEPTKKPALVEDPVRRAIRTNYQLAVALRDHGLSDAAADFSLRARWLETRNLRTEGQWLRYLPQWLMGMSTGYGYSLWRAFASYIGAIITFAVLYWLLGVVQWGFNLGAPKQMSFPEALIVSAYAFHGRGLFSSSATMNSQICLGACEAGVGLLLEICFIAAFTQRFLSK